MLQIQVDWSMFIGIVVKSMIATQVHEKSKFCQEGERECVLRGDLKGVARCNELPSHLALNIYFMCLWLDVSFSN